MTETLVVVADPIVVSDTLVLDPITLGDDNIRIGAPITLNAVLGHAGLWTGHGVPTTVPGAKVGDEYLDEDTGTIYRLTAGA